MPKFIARITFVERNILDLLFAMPREKGLRTELVGLKFNLSPHTESASYHMLVNRYYDRET